MNGTLVAQAFLIGLCFVSWTIVGRRFADGPMLSTVVAIVTAAVVFLISFQGLRSEGSVGPKAFAVLVLLGLVNGFGLAKYASLVARPDTPVASFMVTVSIAMVVITPLLEAVISGKGISLSHVAGYLFAGGAIFLLSR